MAPHNAEVSWLNKRMREGLANRVRVMEEKSSQDAE